VDSPLFLDGWLEFNKRKYDLKPEIITINDENRPLPVLKTVLYFDKKDRIRMPARNPYLPISFTPTPTEAFSSITRQWLRLSGILADMILDKGLNNSIAFPPEIIDLREFQWRHYKITPRYTFYINFPWDLQKSDYSIRKHVNKAIKIGFKCHQVSKWEDIILCLKETEERQGFEHGITTKDLQIAEELVGRDNFRGYVCYSPEGEIASARIVLFKENCRAIDWVAGTRKKFLQSGATQYLIHYVLNDLQQIGAKGFDYAGANIRNVAAAKLNWGVELKPYYVISSPNIKEMAKLIFQWLHFKMRRN